jgi:hypothetical protein
VYRDDVGRLNDSHELRLLQQSEEGIADKIVEALILGAKDGMQPLGRLWLTSSPVGAILG